MSILTKIEIKGLWGTTDIEWDLKSDVNILGGYNGSGKSTVLQIVANAIYNDDNAHKTNPLFNELVLFSTEKKIHVQSFKANSFTEVEEILKNINPHSDSLKNHIRNQYLYNKIPLDTPICFALGTEEKGNKKEALNVKQLQHYFSTQYISTFEQPLIEREIAQKYRFDSLIQTTLDFLLTKLQSEYKNYLLNLSKKVQDLLSNDSIEDVRHAQKEIYQFKKRFEDLINRLFSETGKTLIYEEETNQILFQKGDEKLTPYQLSSGEKQLLIILLSTLIQDNKPTIMLMDEPETGLHIDWQKKLIGYIRELNPNVQIIMTTHSPGLILEKWIDNVVEISEISKIHE